MKKYYLHWIESIYPEDKSDKEVEEFKQKCIEDGGIETDPIENEAISFDMFEYFETDKAETNYNFSEIADEVLEKIRLRGYEAPEIYSISEVDGEIALFTEEEFEI